MSARLLLHAFVRIDQQQRRFGIRRGEPFTIPWSRVLRVERVVRVDIDSDESDVMVSSRWVRDHIVNRIPGASR